MTRLGIKRLNIFAPYRKLLKKAKSIANRTDALKEQYKNLTNEELSAKTQYFLDRLAKGDSLDSFITEAFATVRETVFRVHGIFAYKVQIIGAAVLHFGDFAELYTGEGKTLVCVITAYLNALLKKGVHIVTVNEYLVQRDAKFCAECLNPLHITVGYNLASFNPNEKREMFNCDITYTTNSEVGFDYLRDNMVGRLEDKVMRGLQYAIVDEGDSVLIDEARTPLIISGSPKRNTSSYVLANNFVITLNEEDYKKDPETNSIFLEDSGIEKAEKFFGLKNYHAIENSDLNHKIRNALMANFIFQIGVQYIVRDDEILLVDQFTGRILEGRSYNAGLQQAIQAKEYVKIEPENITVATVTYQSFFRLYKKLSACSGTAFTEEAEFMKIYNMVVVPVPTNKPIIRVDHNDYFFDNKISKWHHVVAEIERLHSKGQPILVGTASVEDSEALAVILRNKGINFEMLNAKNNAKEAEIVKNAGQVGAVTISTNMAGRGTDIKLSEEAKKLGGLYVIGTEKNESRRVDNQLRGRSGRQGYVGETRFFISLQDELFRRFAMDKIDKANDRIDDEKYDSWIFTKMLNGAQKKVEGFNFDSRKNLIDYDSVLANQRELIYKQRDVILTKKENLVIIKNMAEHAAKEMVALNISEKNNNLVDPNRLAIILNKMIFGQDYVSDQFFYGRSLDDAEAIVSEIIKMSIDLRVGALGDEQSTNILKDIIIQNLDFNWTNHLDRVTKIREGVHLRSLEQKSPLNIYVEEADKDFKEMKVNVARSCVTALHRMFIPNAANDLKDQLIRTMPSLFREEVKSDEISNDAKDIKPMINIDDLVLSNATAKEENDNEK
ncbi:MAG: preprotein translocase subunit SecA [Mycoplasmoidaceae bacterium]|nr:MAG: preprotein translocase subunit SecA [Mycoplasmoidaceae bacterium]